MTDIRAEVNATNGTAEKPSLAETIKKMDEKCRNCKPLSMMTCMSECDVWRLKNEFRKLANRRQDPTFTRQLFNTLKNKRRKKVLEMISQKPRSISSLQLELNKLGYHHSQQTIRHEYVNPLIEAEQATEAQNRYHTTLLGSKISETTKNMPAIEDLLPPHSECHEETTLMALQKEPKTYEKMGNTIPPKNVGRVLTRLQKMSLVGTDKEKDHVYFFKSRRNPVKENLSPTEKKVYESIKEEGISARKLAQEAKISLRRTYKYLRRLKGKKMIFAREKPRTYTLTPNGLKTALALKAICDLTNEAFAVAAQMIEGEKDYGSEIQEALETEKAKNAQTIVSVVTMRRSGRNPSGTN